MSMKYLGETLDIHTGGEDNRFPHHENEIAQSEGATGKLFSNIWMHNRHLLLGGKKMAKREGESITIDTLKERGYSPLAFRLLAFAHHYRSPIDFSWELLDEYQGHIQSIQSLLTRISPIPVQDTKNVLPEDFAQALSNDLNTPKAFSIFLQTIKDINRKLDADNDATELVASLFAMDTVVGVLETLQKNSEAQQVPEHITELSNQREQAKQNKEYDKADAIRQEIKGLGYTIEDTPNGPRIYPHLIH
jgi:cysteinyl-tRNA synthetase